METEDYIVRSNEVQDIIGQAPPYLIRTAILLISFFVMLIILVSFIIEYPDSVPGTIVINGDKPTITLKSKSSGLIQFIVKSDENIEPGDYLAYIKNGTSFNDYKELKSFAKKLKVDMEQNSFESMKQMTLPLLSSLGDIQPFYNTFSETLNNLKLLDSQNEEKENSIYLIEEINIIKKQKEKSVENLEYNEIALNMTKQRYKNAISLLKEGTISRKELNNIKEKWLELENKVADSKTGILLDESTITKLKKRLAVGKVKDNRNSLTTKSFLRSNYLSLMTVIKEWEEKYVIVAPTKGKVSLFDVWVNNQYINEAEEVMFIVPQQSNQFGWLKLKGFRIGEIKIGQKVRVELAGYDATRFGYLIGKITNLSEINVNNIYRAKVEFPIGFKTTYGINLGISPEMHGEGEVITENVSLFKRIFNKFTVN
jgi:multidrug resistance efflux pump